MKKKTSIRNVLCSLATLILSAQACLAQESELQQLSKGLLKSKQASGIVQKLQASSQTSLLEVLGAMKGGSEAGQNWLLSVAQTIADRDPSKSAMELEKFLMDDSQAPNARYWAFEFLTQSDTAKREAMLKTMLDDPCLELRYEAVALGMRDLEEGDEDEDEKVAIYKSLFDAARLPTQVQSIAKKLEELEEKVDLKKHFGFICDWKAIGPFDNVEKVGFAKSYPPELDYASSKLDAAKEYSGKTDSVKWIEVATDAEDGAIDLAEAYNKEKGAVVYALGAFESPKAVECEVRLGSPNASKVWVNGDLVISREVYHSGNQIDQYVAPVELKSGKNTILVKSCQNEQKQSWAQDWTFQLRFTDASGAAIQPAE